MNQMWWVILAVILAVLLDWGIIRVWRRYRRIPQDDGSYRERIRAWFGLPIKESSESTLKRALIGFRKKTNTFLRWKTMKTLMFFSSVGCVVFGQYLMSRFVPIEALILTSQRINDRFRIDVKNLDNVIVGILFILVGGVLFAFSTRDIIFRGGHSPSKGKSELSTPSNISVGKTFWIVGSVGLAFLLIRLFFYQAHVVDTLVWIVSIGAFLLSAYWWDRTANISLKINLTPSEIVQLMLVFTLGLVIGVYQLQDIPNSLMGDEGNFFETARSIALGTYHPSPFDLGVYSYSVFGSLWQAWILKVFGISLWGWRFASVLPSVLTIFPLYLLSRDLFGRGVGIVSSLVLIFSPYFLTFSRLGYNNSQSILIVTLCVWLVYLGVTKGSFFYSFLGGAAAGLGFLTYTAGRLGIVIACVYFVFLFLTKSSKSEKKRYLINALFPLILGWVVIAAPHIIYHQQNTPESSRVKMVEGLFFHVHYGQDYYPEDELFFYSPPIEFDQHEFFYNPDIYKELIVRGVVRSLLAFHHKELISEHFISYPLPGPYATVFYALGGFFVFGRLRDRRFLLIALWLVSGLFFLSMISTYPPRHQHLVPVIPVMAIMISLGMIAFSRKFVSIVTSDQNTKRFLQYSLVGLIVISIGVVGLREFFIVMPRMYRPNIEHVMNWFGLHNSPDVSIVYITTEPVGDEWRPYLFRKLLEKHKFTLVDDDEFLESEFDLPIEFDIAVFYDQMKVGQITPKLLEAIPYPNEIIYLNRDQELIGKAVIQGDVVTQHPASLLDGLLDILTSPVMWLVGPLLILLWIYWYQHKQDLAIVLNFGQFDEGEDHPTLQGKIQAGLSDELQEIEKKPAIKMKKGDGFFEFGFYIRFSSGDTIHRFEPKISIHFSQEKDPHEQDDEL